MLILLAGPPVGFVREEVKNISKDASVALMRVSEILERIVAPAPMIPPWLLLIWARNEWLLKFAAVSVIDALVPIAPPRLLSVFPELSICKAASPVTVTFPPMLSL